GRRRGAPRRAPGPAADGVAPEGTTALVGATAAPPDPRNLDRLATRALLGLGRTGATMSNGSGDYVIAFSTSPAVRRRPGTAPRSVQELPNDAMTGLFQAVAEATEEAIVNSLFRATTVAGHRGTVEALPIPETLDVLRKYNALEWDRTLPPGRAG